MRRTSYERTVTACFTGYIVQAIINNFAPLLFLTFQRSYGIPLTKIALLISINFAVQLCVDLVSAVFADRVGYRKLMIAAHILSAAGLVMLAGLPQIMDPYTGLLVSVIVYAVGGGLLEVLVSPVMEACPTENKAKAMSMLHSFYCWGHVGVVLISAIWFACAGIGRWKILSCLWALVPLYNAYVFTYVPIAPLVSDERGSMPFKELTSDRIFWILMVMMIAAGAAEQSVSQWVSAYCEKALGISKSIGDICGPAGFAFLMGCSRLYYGKRGENLHLHTYMLGSILLCIVCYLCISLPSARMVNLAACALCGFSVGIFWPGTFNMATAALPRGGTAMFALLALGGDIGCSIGPALVGTVSELFMEQMKYGMLAAVIFPAVLLAGMMFLKRECK